jgi:hypothetical protein
MLARCAVTTIVALAGFGVVGAQQDAPNVVLDPSLEGALADTGLPEGWLAFVDPPDSYTIAVVPGGHTGEKGLLIEGDGQLAGVTTTRVPVEAGKRYLVRGWVKIEGAQDATATVQAGFSDDAGGYLGTTWLGNATPTRQDWQCISVPAHADDMPEAATVCVSVSVSGKARVRFDDLELVVADAPAHGENLLANGSMEDVVDGAPAFWTPFTEPGALVSLSANDEAPQEGGHCLCLSGDAPYVVALGERYRVEGDRTFTLSGHARAVAGDAVLTIDYDEDGQYLGNTESLHVSGPEWEAVSVTTDFLGFPTATHFRVTVAAADGSVEAYFDDLQLVEE